MGKTKTLGIIFLIVSIIGVVLGLGLTFGLPGYFIMQASGADEFDAWVETAEERDSREFVGTIAEREEILGIWFYKFEGCDSYFYGSQGNLEEGSYVYIEIVIEDGIPRVLSELSYVICGVPGGICTVIFLILLVISIIIFVKGRKEDKLAGPRRPTQDLTQASAIVQQVQQQEQMYYQQQQQQQPQYGYGGGQPAYGGGAQPPRMCQRCGGSANFYPDRNAYWCNRCNQYA